MVVFLLVSFRAFAIDTEITVLAVTTGGADVNTVVTQMDYLAEHWPSSNGVPVFLVNGGVPVTLTSTVFTGSALTQLASITQHPNWDGLRTTYGADIMLVFTGSISGSCGQAIQYNWTSSLDPIPGIFSQNPQGLDLNGRDDSYYALVSTNGICPVLTAAHEFGHLFGGGHTREFNFDEYLFDDSHAFAIVIEITGPPSEPSEFFGIKSILAEYGNPPACKSQGPISCEYSNVFSSSSGDADNQGTFSVTALSVAN